MPFEVLLIVLVSIVGGLVYSAYETHMKAKTKMLNSKPNRETELEIQQLKERVEVLEKIITDEKYQLRSEINSLNKAG